MLSLQTYDIIILDLEMPVMNGFETITRIRSGSYGATLAKIPVIAMTAYTEEKIKERCFTLGFNDFITKPINVFDIDQLLFRHLLSIL